MSIFAKARAEYALKHAAKTNKKAEASLLGHAAKKARRERATVGLIPPPETTVKAPAAAAPDAAHAPAAEAASMPHKKTQADIPTVQKFNSMADSAASFSEHKPNFLL
jgi:hypothetical protein